MWRGHPAGGVTTEGHSAATGQITRLATSNSKKARVVVVVTSSSAGTVPLQKAGMKPPAKAETQTRTEAE